jgi:hypothetical protein
MFYAAFSFYPFASIRARHAEALTKAGDSRAEKSSQAATIFACSSQQPVFLSRAFAQPTSEGRRRRQTKVYSAAACLFAFGIKKFEK